LLSCVLPELEWGKFIQSFNKQTRLAANDKMRKDFASAV
jgi:hypothetical protein